MFPSECDVSVAVDRHELRTWLELAETKPSCQISVVRFGMDTGEDGRQAESVYQLADVAQSVDGGT